MNKAEIVDLLKDGRPLFAQVAEHALSILDTAKKVSIHENPRLLEKEDCLSIYSRRLAHSEHTGKRVSGLKETVDAFAKGEGPYRAIAITADANTMYCWADSRGHMIGCIVP